MSREPHTMNRRPVAARAAFASEADGGVAMLLGNEAVVRGALEAGVAFVAGYPGTPSSEITDTFARVAAARGVAFEYSVNEKIAVEMAFAAALAGARSLCAMKHLGLMAAGDPISTIPYVGVEAGMVIVSAGDPSCLTSPNEQDQRHLAAMLHLPCLDPGDPAEAGEFTRRAFALSEACRLPVLLRMTTRVCHSRAAVPLGRLATPEVRGFRRDPPRYNPVPAHARRMREELFARLETVARETAGAPFVLHRPGTTRRGLIAAGGCRTTLDDVLAECGLGIAECGVSPGSGLQASGFGVEGSVALQCEARSPKSEACPAPKTHASRLMPEGLHRLDLGVVHPLPEAALAAFLDAVDEVLIVEELSPFLEDAIAAFAARSGRRVTLYGKRSGHLPTAFEYQPAHLERALAAAFGAEAGPASGFGLRASHWRATLPSTPKPEAWSPEPEGAPQSAIGQSDLPPRPPNLCPGCPHRASYFAAVSVFGEDRLYFNDIGCYTLGLGAPLDASDALLCMGAGLTLAAGVSRVTGLRTVGVIGDSTFFHSGMPALLNAAKEQANVAVVILDNGVTGMTGFQDSPGVRLDAGRLHRTPRIEDVVRGLGLARVETVDPFDLPATMAAFARARDAAGPAVVVLERPCPMYLDREGALVRGPAFTIDADRCQHCGFEPAGLRCHLPLDRAHERHAAATRARERGSGGGGGEPQGAASGVGLQASDQARATLKPEVWSLKPGVTPHSALRTPHSAVAPCGAACPLGLCVQGYAGRLAAGLDREAFEQIALRTLLPETVCRVCHHPCEAACVYGADDAVAINDLKRFAVARGRAADWPVPWDAEPAHGRAVAVVGAGPAGLAAALDLRRRGYEVTLYDAAREPGGLLRTGIPAFRLPRDALARDLARVFAAGVRFAGERRLGADLRLAALLDEYEAVVLALGAARGRTLALPGAELPGAPAVYDGLAWMRAALAEAESGGDGRTNRRAAIVIGGGNAAVDTARMLRRAGAAVALVCLEARAEMPAAQDEIAAALDEGVALLPRWRVRALAPGTVELIGVAPPPPAAAGTERTGREGEPLLPVWDGRPARPAKVDARGRDARATLAPEQFVDDPARRRTLTADAVLLAIGQEPAPFAAPGDPPLERLADGRVAADPADGRTSHPRVFAAGDLAPGPRTVADAIAAGRRAAWGVDEARRGRGAADRLRPPPGGGGGFRISDFGRGAPCGRPQGAPLPHAGDPPPSALRSPPSPRRRPVERARAERLADGAAEVRAVFTDAAARAEAARCRLCGQCGNCRACLDLFGCPAFFVADGRIRIDAMLCNGCGVCADFCPNGAIVPAEARR